MNESTTALAPAVTAKFVVTSVEVFHGQIDKDTLDANVTLRAVTSGSEENESWSRYTPSGEIRMQITNPDAVARFIEGQEYFVDFTPAQ